MVENDLVVDSHTVTYKGVFDADELIALVNRESKKMGYTMQTLERSEDVTSTGRTITIRKEPYREIREYAQLKISIEIIFEDIKEKIVKRFGSKQKLMEGSAKITMWGWLTLDWENRWQKKELAYFISTLFDAFIKKWQTEKLKPVVASELKSLSTKLTEFFRQYDY